MSNCLYWAVANLPVIQLHKPNAYIVTAEGYRYEEGIKFKCLIHAAVNLKHKHLNNCYMDSEGMYSSSCIDTWINKWKQEREKENCKYWDYSTHIYLLKDIKTKRFWNRMKSLGSPYDENILEQKRMNIFERCYLDH